MTNEQMREGRYARWHRARRLVAWIQDRLRAGWMVQVSSYTRHTRYQDVRHVELVSCNSVRCICAARQALGLYRLLQGSGV